MGWWKMAISYLKHSYLNWKANPCRKIMILVFHHFSTHFWLFWFSFRLNQNFQVQDMTINCSFVLFFLFRELSTLGNVACCRWPFSLKHLFSCKDCFERVSFFGPQLFISFLSTKRVIAQKYSKKMGNIFNGILKLRTLLRSLFIKYKAVKTTSPQKKLRNIIGKHDSSSNF